MEEENDTLIKEAGESLRRARSEMGKRVIGQVGLIDGLLTGLIAGGHVLVEGLPGLAKTLAVRALSDLSKTLFKRIQFTPDLLPADITGTMIYRQQTGEFVARKGPIFSNVLLADEINRAPAKVQAALLEAMGEQQVTIGEKTYPLPDPFFVMATQNPIEQEGTYRLPEAQLDRFLIKINVGYPSPNEELTILENKVDNPELPLSPFLNSKKIITLKKAAELIKAEESIRRYIVSLVSASRIKDRRKLPFSRYIEYGASPRATLSIYRCARVQALFAGRRFMLPEDVKSVVPLALRHRIVLSYEAEAEQMDSDAVIAGLLATVSVP